MKSRRLNVIHKPARKRLPGKCLSLFTTVLTIGASVGIGVMVNPERSWAGACAGVYSTRNGSGSTGFIGYYNSISKSYVDIVTYTNGNNINAIATQPSTGDLFFVNRATSKVVVYNVNTGTFTTLTGTLPSTATIVGATFLPSGKLYIYYTDRTLVEVNPATGAQVGSTIPISGIPGNAGSTNGDIAVGTDGTLYALGDTSASTSQLYSITIAGTTGTATPVNGSNNISGVNAANGLAIDPATGKFYVSASTGTYELDPTTKVATLLTSIAGVTDLAACGSPTPDVPTITKAFSPTNVTGTPATSTLTLTLGNTNSVPIYLIQTLTDTLPSGLTVSTPNGLGGTCTAIAGNTVTATAGSNTISLINGFKLPAGGCSVTVNVTTNSTGTYTNTIPAGDLKTFAGDNATAASATLTVSPASVTVSGTVFDDADGSITINGSEIGTNAGSTNLTVYAINTAGNVVDKATVATNGTYSLTNVPQSASVTLRLSNASTVAVGAVAPTAASLPANWVNTGENKNGATETTTPGDIAVTTATTNVTNQNFGIEQLPTTTDVAAASQTNPGGTATVQVPTLAGTDPEDGALGSGKTFRIVTLPTNGTLTYNNVAVTAGQTIANYNPTLLKLDPNNGAVTVTFTYAAVDAAGQADATPATVTMPFTVPASITVSGTVFDDADGSITINGSDAGTNAGSSSLTIYAIDTTGKVIDKATVGATGTYSLTNIPQNASVTLRLSNDSTVAIGATAPTAASLPSNWVNTGESKNGTTETITPGDIALTTTTVNVANQNFGIEQLPNTTNLSSAAQPNPGGTTTVQVPTLAGTDPEDGALGSGKTFKIVTLPTNGTLTYNNAAVTAGQVISNYDPTLLKLDPNDGAITVSFTYAAIDAAGKEDPTPATVTMTFTAATATPSILLVKRITAVNGANIATTVDDPGSTNDNAANWPNPIDATSGISAYLKGVINGGTLRPGDLLEYTIYFLSNGGAAATNINLCDLVPTNSTFVPDSFSSTPESGINLTIGATSTNLTNVPDADGGQFFNSGGTPSVSCSAANTNGAVVVNVVKSPANLPNATAPGTPTNSYGFIRFRAKVN